MAVNSFNAQNPPVTTKGDVFTFSTIPTRLAVGANNTVLTADSSTATGLKWATVSGGGMTELATGSLSGSTVTLSNISQSYIDLILFLDNLSGTQNANVAVQVNGGGTFDRSSVQMNGSTVETNGSSGGGNFFINPTSIISSATTNRFAIRFLNYAVSGYPYGNWTYQYTTTTSQSNSGTGSWIDRSGSSTVSSISISLSTGNFDNGTYKLYGVK